MKLPIGGKLNIGHVFIALGLLSIVMTYIIINRLVNGGKQASDVKPAQSFELTSLVVANRYINAGEMLNDSDIKKVSWPVKYYPLGDVYNKVDDIIGHVAQSDLYPGQPVFKGSISGEVADGGLMWIVPKGMRAITIGVNEIKGVAGFIKPGSHVDVLATLNYGVTPLSPSVTAGQSAPQKEDVKITTTVLQDIKVLAVAQQLYADHPTGGDTHKTTNATTSSSPVIQQPASSITLAVTPKQAEILALAENQGDLKLVLRQQEDAEQLSLGGAGDPDVVTDTTIFTRVLDFISERTLGGLSANYTGINASAPVVKSTRLSTAIALPRSTGQHHITIIKGTEMTDTYVSH